MKTNALNWFELYVSDIDRAKRFYDAVIVTTLQAIEGETPMAIFPYKQGSGVGGSLVKAPHGAPGAGGTTIYLNVEGDLDGVLARIPDAGGRVIRAKTEIPPNGFIALMEDTEGNIVGLHSMS